MFNSWVNEIFSRVNDRKGIIRLNEISVPNFLHPFVTCVCLVFLTYTYLDISNGK